MQRTSSHDNDPCECGHPKYIHPPEHFLCIAEVDAWYLLCNCRGYKLDNLKYLEQKYEE